MSGLDGGGKKDASSKKTAQKKRATISDYSLILHFKTASI